MMQKILRAAISLMGLFIGIPIAGSLLRNTPILTYIPNEVVIYAGCMLLSALILFILLPLFTAGVKKLSAGFEEGMEDSNILEISYSVGGLIIGLVLAALIASAFNQIPIPWVSWALTIPTYLILGYMGFTLPRQRMDEINNLFGKMRQPKEPTGATTKVKKKDAAHAKLLDTSVIIDGRIHDIFRTGFMEGPLIVPVYVLNELQLISDSADDLKRSKGRRGLDIVAQLQKEYDGEIIVLEEDYDDIHEVDAKLIKMAKSRKWKIVTNDYNLNKLASVQGIQILNINDLANAVKTVVLPGEEMSVTLIKAGKENGQAVGYLEDGTMIVVENGRGLIGQTIGVDVTSVLQTSAGRMIFAKPKHDMNHDGRKRLSAV